MTINLTINVQSGSDFLCALEAAVESLECLATVKKENYKRMPLSTAEQAIVDRFNAATTAVSNKIDALIANSANLDDAEFNAQLQTIADGLDALGKPATPIPGPGPQPTP